MPQALFNRCERHACCDVTCRMPTESVGKCEEASSREAQDGILVSGSSQPGQAVRTDFQAKLTRLRCELQRGLRHTGGVWVHEWTDHNPAEVFRAVPVENVYAFCPFGPFRSFWPRV